jgi:hypothetical protein
MNLLVRLLLKEPRLVDELASGETVGFAELVDGLPVDTEAGSVARALRDDPVAEQQLHTLGYLQVLPAPRWEEALTLARQGGLSRAPEWVTMVPGRYGEIGLTLPEDAYPIRRVSFFSRMQDIPGVGVRRISIDAVGKNTLGSFSISVNNGHCELPSRGHCAPGQCGRCTSREREAEPRGIVCACSHDV